MEIRRLIDIITQLWIVTCELKIVLAVEFEKKIVHSPNIRRK